MNLNLFPILFFLLCTLPVSQISAQAKPLPNAHAHNDYKHKHPLTDALDNGFTSYEADVFFKKGKFIVAHVSPLFKKKRTLEALYLKPLYENTLKHNGNVLPNYAKPVVLLIDVKTDAEQLYIAMKPLLEKYNSILTSCTNGEISERAVTIIFSGNKPYQAVNNESTRVAFIDESLMNIEKDHFTSAICPLASTKYSNVLTWKGRGAIPEDEKQKLIGLVSTAHIQGKKVRLWASPENKNVWKELLNCGVDLINTDDLEGFREFSEKN